MKAGVFVSAQFNKEISLGLILQVLTTIIAGVWIMASLRVDIEVIKATQEGTTISIQQVIKDVDYVRARIDKHTENEK